LPIQLHGRKSPQNRQTESTIIETVQIRLFARPISKPKRQTVTPPAKNFPVPISGTTRPFPPLHGANPDAGLKFVFWVVWGVDLVRVSGQDCHNTVFVIQWRRGWCVTEMQKSRAVEK
jgi:hypothetical protein